MQEDSQRWRQAEVVDDLIQACDWAHDLVAQGRRRFDSEPLLRLSAEAIVTRLGEGFARLSDETLALEPALPRRLVKAMRNRVVHEYHRIDYDIVWSGLEIDVPHLAAGLRRLRDRLR